MKKFLLVVAAVAGAVAGVAIWKRRTQPASADSHVDSWAESVSVAARVEVAKSAEEPLAEPAEELAEAPVEEVAVKKPRRKKPAPTPDAEG